LITKCSNNKIDKFDKSYIAMMSLSPNKEITRLWFEELIGNNNLELVHEIVHNEYRDGPFHKGITGPEFIKNKFSGFANLIQNTQIEIKSYVEEDDKVVLHYVFSAEVIDSFMGIKAPGKRFTQEGVTFFTIKDGKIFYTWGTYDRKSIIDDLST